MYSVSIYCSSFDLSDDQEFPVAGPAPLVYQNSAHRPSDQDERRGSLELSYIPGFIDDAQQEEEPYRPWLRMGLESTEHVLPAGQRRRADVLLDRQQVEALHKYLGEWLSKTVSS